MKKIGFIGAGNMGGALARAVAKSANKVYISDADENKARALACEVGGEVLDSVGIVAECDMIFLGVKPQILPLLAGEIKASLDGRKGDFCLVSMAAGVRLERLSELFGDLKFIRIMPNTPASVGAGVILYALGKKACGEDEKLLCEALSQAGSLNRLDEKLIDAATAVSGCGPAFAYMFIEALADGGVKCGLPRDKAQKFAAEMLLGSAKLCLESDKHPGELKDAVCSPGGSTIAGVAALEERGFRGSVIDAVEAAFERTKELSGD